jgi:hypothetical protein
MSIDDIDAMDADPILSIRYGCVNWVRYLHQMDGAYNDGFRRGGRIDQLLKDNFLHWLVSISWTRSMAQSIGMIRDLQ